MRENLKEEILNKSGKLFSEAGFFGTSMNDIAKSLNVTKPALYYHFKNKKELYLEVLERAFQRLSKNLRKNIKTTESFEQKLFQSIKNYLEWGIDEKNLIKAQMIRFPESDIELREGILNLKSKTEKELSEVLKEVLKKEVNLKFITGFLLGVMDRAILEAGFLGKKLDIRKNTSQILKALNPFINPHT